MSTMFNPPHPGEILSEEILKPLGLSAAKSARLLGVSRESILRVINGDERITYQMATQLETAFKPSAESWLRHQAAYDLWQIKQSEYISISL